MIVGSFIDVSITFANVSIFPNISMTIPIPIVLISIMELYYHKAFVFIFLQLLMVKNFARRRKYHMRKILMGENIDEFDEFPAIRQYFSYQKFPFS